MRLVTRDPVYIPGYNIHVRRVNMAQRDAKYDFVSAVYALQPSGLYLIYLNEGKGESHSDIPFPGTAN